MLSSVLVSSGAGKLLVDSKKLAISCGGMIYYSVDGLDSDLSTLKLINLGFR